jgi:hypothetical protein
METSLVPGLADSVRASAAREAAPRLRRRPAPVEPLPPVQVPCGPTLPRVVLRRQPLPQVIIGRAMPAVPRDLPAPGAGGAAVADAGDAQPIPAFLRA